MSKALRIIIKSPSSRESPVNRKNENWTDNKTSWLSTKKKPRLHSPAVSDHYKNDKAIKRWSSRRFWPPLSSSDVATTKRTSRTSSSSLRRGSSTLPSLHTFLGVPSSFTSTTSSIWRFGRGLIHFWQVCSVWRNSRLHLCQNSLARCCTLLHLLRR